MVWVVLVCFYKPKVCGILYLGRLSIIFDELCYSNYYYTPHSWTLMTFAGITVFVLFFMCLCVNAMCVPVPEEQRVLDPLVPKQAAVSYLTWV